MHRLLVSLIVAFLATSGLAAAKTATAVTAISVNGTATITVMPDQATVNASVVTNAENASQAVSDNNRRYGTIVDALVRAGIRRDDVTLSYYNVNYVPKPNPAPPNPSPYDRYGYTVTRSFAVKVRDMNRAGAVVDAATGAGATNIEGVAFGLAHPETAQSQATRKAVADARSKAEELAKAAGLHVVGIQSIQLEGAPAVRPLVMAKTMAAASTPTEFDAGNVNVSVNVTVVFSAAP